MNDLIVSLMGDLCTLVGVIVTCLVTSSGTKRLTEYRLNKSVELLTNTDKSILEIAYDTGFSNSSYYTEIFGGRFGCTPSQYRKRARPRGGAADTI